MIHRIQHWLKHSLATRLTLLILLATILAWSAFSAVLLYETRQETAEVLDDQLTAYADMLWQNLGGEDDLRSNNNKDTDYHDELAFAVYHLDGRLVAASQLMPFPIQPRASKKPYAIALNGKEWQITVRSSDNHQLIVGEPLKNQLKIAEELSEHLLEIALWALLLLLPLLYLAIRQGLKPLKVVDAELARRAPNNLDALNIIVPSEIAPLRDRLNTLFAQVSQTLARERRFTADAAHELRTPLAGLRVQIELAQSSPRPETREKALGKAIQGVDRTTRLVTQLLALSRLDHGETPQFEAISLSDLARSALLEAHLPADEAHLRVEQPCALIGQPLLLGLLLRNLLENAKHYAGQDAEIVIQIRGATLSVCDNGPGVSADDLARIGQRFYRPAGQSQPGAGLGLSIVRRIADLHLAKFKISNRASGGFCAEIMFRREAQ
ncbi:ATP-binding protein [Deefgea salmonis]|uniref:histidine kinase n=1 Tax=Deefgea salmonis TaxID=2875502 RepID=A0ABS8BMQ0_9NEIS|nr:ATP-binding protein [Deefgea salmonis]MCB5197013.1 hypothetical protein [Deefgea salmonis]